MGGVRISRHAIERIAERGADDIFVEAVADGLVKRVLRPSKSQSDCDILTARDDNGVYWSIVFNRCHLVVVTVRRATKKEILDYVQNA